MRAKRIGWNNVSLVVDVTIMSVAISRTSSRFYARLPKGSLASLAHLVNSGKGCVGADEIVCSGKACCWGDRLAPRSAAPSEKTG